VCTVCGKTEGQLEGKMKKCDRCEAAYYCSVECQATDRSKHELVCKQMAVEQKERSAALAEAKAAAKAKAKAAAALPRCLTCSKTSKDGGGDLSTCSRCNTARYCSRECQVKDFPRHKTADGCKKK
jgi:hypothetical protein